MTDSTNPGTISANERPAGCPPWCARTHNAKNNHVHEVIVGGYGVQRCGSQVTVEQFDGREPELIVWALASPVGDLGQIKVRLCASEGRLLARALREVPPSELADFIRALDSAADVLDGRVDQITPAAER